MSMLKRELCVKEFLKQPFPEDIRTAIRRCCRVFIILKYLILPIKKEKKIEIKSQKSKLFTKTLPWITDFIHQECNMLIELCNTFYIQELNLHQFSISSEEINIQYRSMLSF